MKKSPCLLLGALAFWLGSEPVTAGWRDILPGHFRGVQYYGARRYVKPIAPQVQPAPPPAQRPAGAVSPTPPPLPGTAPAPGPSPQKQDKNTAEKSAALKRTIEFQMQRAKDGSATAQYDLGKHYLTGDGLERSLPEARRWFEAAAKQEHPGAVSKLDEIKRLEAAAAAPAPAPTK